MCMLIIFGMVLDIACMNGLSINNSLVEVLPALDVGLELRTDLASQFVNCLLF